MQETQVRSLGQEDPLEEEMATQSSILAWENLWTEKTGGLQSMGSQRCGHNLVTQQEEEARIRQVEALLWQAFQSWTISADALGA